MTKAIFLNLEGRIAEGPGENIFIVRGRTVKTNGTKNPFSRASPGQASWKSPPTCGYRTEIGPITKEDSSARMKPSLPGRPWRSRPWSGWRTGRTRAGENEHRDRRRQARESLPRTQGRFMDIVSGKVPKYEKWSTSVLLIESRAFTKNRP